MKVVIAGGGIAGLACAHRLHQLRPDVELEVREAADRVGGKIRTSPIAGIVVDEAADAFLARVPAAVSLCRELGLGDQLVSPAARSAFVYRHGSLHRFPAGLVLGVPTDLDAPGLDEVLSVEGRRRAALDLELPRDLPGAPAAGTDETVGSLVRRRVGDEVMDALVGPLLSGVNAGDADELSVAAGAPQLAAAVRDQPSLIAGLRALQQAATTDPDAPVFFGLRGGSETLIRALADALPAGTVRTGAAVTQLDAAGRGFVVDGTPADAVVLAVPSFAAAPLLAPIDAAVASELEALAWSSAVLVTFAVRRGDIDHPLDGSGFLVSEGEGLLLTACSFGSSKWAHWREAGEADGADDHPPDPTPPSDPDALVILRASAGRWQDPRAAAMTDDQVAAALLDDLATTIGLHGPPVATRVSRWDRALPQYRPGHLERARRWKDTIAARRPGVFLTGASYFGLGVPACITDADDTAVAVAAHLDALGAGDAPGASGG